MTNLQKQRRKRAIRRALTDKLAVSLTSNDKPQFEHFDATVSGLLLRVTKAAAKVWDFTFRSPVEGKRARLKIGPYGTVPGISLKVARGPVVVMLACV
jgi:hypothetical protein